MPSKLRSVTVAGLQGGMSRVLSIEIVILAASRRSCLSGS